MAIVADLSGNNTHAPDAAVVLDSFRTVAQLPAGGVRRGMKMYVTDASGPTLGAAVVGGGSDIVPVYFSGSDWRVG